MDAQPEAFVNLNSLSRESGDAIQLLNFRRQLEVVHKPCAHGVHVWRALMRLDREYRVDMVSYGCADTIVAVANQRNI